MLDADQAHSLAPKNCACLLPLTPEVNSAVTTASTIVSFSALHKNLRSRQFPF